MFNRIFAKLRKYKEKLVTSFLVYFQIVYFHSNPIKEILFFL